jgi:hypothetical protein
MIRQTMTVINQSMAPGIVTEMGKKNVTVGARVSERVSWQRGAVTRPSGLLDQPFAQIFMNSPSQDQEDNLRRFLDQRAASARADIHHARIPSLTEFSDSPSIYSHAHFSPCPPHLGSSPPHFDFAIPPQYVRPSFEAVRSFSPPAFGNRDLATDGTASTIHTHRERSPSPESIPPDDEEPDPRLSFLGPTMRFHSPAPWETEESFTDEPEQEDDPRSFATKRSRSKTRGDGFIKTFGRIAPAKATSVARSSLESANGREKVSIDSHVAHAASQ